MDETVKIQIRPTKQGDKTETHIPEVDYTNLMCHSGLTETMMS